MTPHLAMILFAAIISWSFSLGALAAQHIDPFALTGARFALASVVVGALVWVKARKDGAAPHPAVRIVDTMDGERQVPPRSAVGASAFFRSRLRFFIPGALVAIYFTTMFEALKTTPPVSLSVEFTLIPLMTAAIAFIWMRQRVTRRMGVALVIGALGALWVIFRGDPARLLGFRMEYGAAVFLVGCVAYAGYAPSLKALTRGEPGLVVSLYTLLGAATLTIAYGLRPILATDWAALQLIVWGALVYLAVAATAISFLLIQYAAMRLPSAKVMAYAYLIPSFVVLWEGLMGHGWTEARVGIGVLATLVALALLLAQEGGESPRV